MFIAHTDNYSVAEQRAKRGVDTSNVESDEEPAKRAVTKPIRFRVEPPVSPSGSQEEAGQDRASESDQELPSLLDEPVASEMPAGYIKDLQAVEMRIMLKLEMIRTEFKTALNQVMEAIEARQPKESESLGQLEMLQNPAETNEELNDICETLRLPISK
ncbi:hypothetical protein J4Q44_G00069480 [Coregonus suidteri]|uniref:Uncharacterized protein n=1 Tax=Coregonus suidteri TaxID=861788 RepID=A0AAN8N630_9TELE